MQGLMTGTPTSQSKQEWNSLDRANMHNSRNNIQGRARQKCLDIIDFSRVDSECQKKAFTKRGFQRISILL